MKLGTTVGALLLVAAGTMPSLAQPMAAGADSSKAIAAQTAESTRGDIHIETETSAALRQEQRGAMRDMVVSARSQEKAAGATREQVHAIRAALRARLATLHH